MQVPSQTNVSRLSHNQQSNAGPSGAGQHTISDQACDSREVEDSEPNSMTDQEIGSSAPVPFGQTSFQISAAARPDRAESSQVAEEVVTPSAAGKISTNSQTQGRTVLGRQPGRGRGRGRHRVNLG